MNNIDLHTHSSISDGTLSPKELVMMASELNLKAFALTDHDSIAGCKTAKKYAEENNVEFISGVELSASYKDDDEIHIVGLFIDEESKELNYGLDNARKRREDRNLLLIDKINSLGIDLNYKDLLEISPDGILSRAHFAKVLVNFGVTATVNESFEKYLGKGGLAYVPKEMIDYRDAISLIKSSGGVAVLAHPLLYKLEEDRLEKMLLSLKIAGLSGVECMYSTHSEEDTEYLLSLSNKYNLLPSGGSDFHGDNKPDINLGSGRNNLNIEYKILEQLREVVDNNG